MNDKGEITASCPFCKSSEELYVDKDESDVHLFAKVRCDNCLSSGPMHGWVDGDDGRIFSKWSVLYHDSKEEAMQAAIDGWNNR